ncbi:DUF6998 domain-containing protein [Cellvibrio polysaccharolyticus]|uniref:DUF6998 domain-containing protein n=1 Tax=Cellvibrio polysaccharolyticus TaxID=2082724 RepID=A0A928V3S6_9GAMM|nr:hypothetical protein [Cellvibrio polysaccharolyticus]MBE8716109.1 hypothetical protein [Cellvibrio polysaccharolyticus]
MQIQDLTVTSFLQLQASITSELRSRGVVRTHNNPLGDYTEWLVARALNLKLQASSTAGYDGIGRDGLRVQIKGRRTTPNSSSRQLSAIRKYDEKDFDALVAVIYDEAFNIIDALLIPHGVIRDYAVYRAHVNAHILILKGAILKDPRVQCIKSKIVESML